MKTCTKCKEEKPLEAFPPRRDRSPDGVHTECRDCRRRYMREYMRQRRAANPEAELEAQRQWRAKNPEADRAKQIRYREAHRERLRERDRERRRKNPEVVREHYRKWRAKNRDQELIRLATRHALTTATPELRRFVAKLRSDACAYCGSTENITIDHIVPLSRGGKHEPANLAPACWTCNCSKGARLLSEWSGPREQAA